jgi:hypothetical protein
MHYKNHRNLMKKLTVEWLFKTKKIKESPHVINNTY